MNNKPRHILPAAHTAGEANPVPADPLKGLPARRRHPLSVACEHCRLKKTACDGRRPSCGRCLGRGISCTYRPAKRSNAEDLLARHEAFVNNLRQLPEDDAIHLLRHFRLAADSEAFLKSVDAGAVLSLLRPSDLRTARWTGPPAQTATEFELMAQHQAAYLKIEPVAPSFLGRLVDMPRSPARSPPRTTTASPPSELAGGEQGRSKEHRRISAPPRNVPRGNITLPRPADGSGVPMHLCDERLTQIQLDYWTRVPIADNFAAAALSHYLEKDHMMMDFFDADAVLDDLVTCRARFCTPFLASSLMFVACSYTLVDVTAAPLAVCFFKEAEMLFRGEETADSVATLAALMMFGHAAVCYGKDVFGQRLLDLGQGMGQRLALFAVSPDDPLMLRLHGRSADWKRTASHTAWGSFSYFALFNSFYPRAPIRYPPVLPMPGKEDDEITRQPTTEKGPPPAPRHTSPYFYMQCRLWVIALEVASVYKQLSDVPISARVPLAFVEGKYRKLVACMDELGEDRVRGGDCPAHVLILHIYFNVIVLSIFHPFIQEASLVNCMRSLAAPDSNPKTIYAASVNQLKQLTLWYYLRDGESMSIWVNPGFLVLVGALMRDEGTADLSERLYVLLCIRCCANLYVAYPIYIDIARAFLAMALQRSAVSGGEASELLARIRRHGTHHANIDEVVSNTCMDADFASTAPRAGAHDVAQLFEDLSMFDQFTTGEYVVGDEV